MRAKEAVRQGLSGWVAGWPFPLGGSMPRHAASPGKRGWRAPVIEPVRGRWRPAVSSFGLSWFWLIPALAGGEGARTRRRASQLTGPAGFAPVAWHGRAAAWRGDRAQVPGRARGADLGRQDPPAPWTKQLTTG